MTKTRTIWTTIAVACATALSVGTLAAQDPAQGRGRGGRGGPGGGPLPILRQLDLTDAQREQVRAILEQQRPDDNAMRKVGELHEALTAAVFADAPDTAKIEQLKAEIGQAEAAALAQRVDLELRIASILTPEQRQKARELPPGAGRGRGGPGR
jgi:periplasmic protein CpxP/Spy